MGNLKFHDIHKLNELYCLDSNSDDKVPAIREPSGEQMPDITVTRADLRPLVPDDRCLIAIWNRLRRWVFKGLREEYENQHPQPLRSDGNG